MEVVGSNPTVPTNHRIFLSLSFGGNRGFNYLVSFLQTFCITLAMLSNPSLKCTYQSHKVLLNLLGTKVDGICRHLGISSDTLYNWRSKMKDWRSTKLNAYGNLNPRTTNSSAY